MRATVMKLYSNIYETLVSNRVKFGADLPQDFGAMTDFPPKLRESARQDFSNDRNYPTFYSIEFRTT